MSRIYSSMMMRSMAGRPSPDPSTPSGSSRIVPRGRKAVATAVAAVMSSIPSSMHGGAVGRVVAGSECGCPCARRASKASCRWGRLSTTHALACSSCTAAHSRGMNEAPPLSLLLQRSSWSALPSEKGISAMECCLGLMETYSATLAMRLSKASPPLSASSVPAQGRQASTVYTRWSAHGCHRRPSPPPFPSAAALAVATMSDSRARRLEGRMTLVSTSAARKRSSILYLCRSPCWTED
mmetsp:Transcript_35350/g.100068  ORF Transcript_35350/g.100068 Transcript_35350/m.100068 type:complete len:239 (+) Transcript_35350:304-1020(+)